MSNLLKNLRYFLSLRLYNTKLRSLSDIREKFDHISVRGNNVTENVNRKIRQQKELRQNLCAQSML